VFGLLCLALTGTAQAANIDNARSFDLQVQGTITERCALGSVPSVNFGNLMRRGLRAAANVQLSCNTPFTMSIRAANGGLAHETLPGGQGGYEGSVPYSLAVGFPVRSPQSSQVAQTFTSQQLRGGGSLTSNGGIATDGMEIAIALANPPAGGLLAGNYGETITITISPL
jgi:spore coat protein U-like protein